MERPDGPAECQVGFHEYKYAVDFDHGQTRIVSDPCTRHGGSIGGRLRAETLPRRTPNHTRPTAERLLVTDCLSALIQRGRGADQGLPRAESLRSWGAALRVVLGAGSRGLTPALPGRQSGRNARTLPSRIVMLSTATHRTPHQQKKLAPRRARCGGWHRCAGCITALPCIGTDSVLRLYTPSHSG